MGLGLSRNHNALAPAAAPMADGRAAQPEAAGRVTAAQAPMRPKTPMPASPTHRRVRAAIPTETAARPSRVTIPTRSASLSLVPNQSMASRLTPAGT